MSNIHTSQDGAVFKLRFNRPEKKNAILGAMYADAAAAFNTANNDPQVRVLVITGAGDSFCAGNDLKDFLDNPPTDKDAPVFRFMNAVQAFQKPVIAAVNGVAIGIGTTVLLHCDFAYAAPSAKFQLPFVNLALMPEFGSSLLLPRFVGTRKAAELLLLAEVFDAATARDIGLLNAVVEADQLQEFVAAKARILASKPPASMRATKALLRSDRQNIADQVAMENEIFGERLKSAELKEAVTAFLEKRPADFSKF